MGYVTGVCMRMSVKEKAKVCEGNGLSTVDGPFAPNFFSPLPFLSQIESDVNKPGVCLQRN